MPSLATTRIAETGEPSLLAERWERLHAQARYCPRYPDEPVVRFALTSFPDRSEAPRALDLGCGAGRHALFLAEEGFETFAVDVSRAGVETAVRRAADRNLDVGVVVAGVDSFELPADFFDAVLCNAVYCYLPMERIAASIERVLRTLRPGGRFLCVTRSDQDWRAGYGTATGPSRMRLSGLDDDTPGAAEDGMEMTFLTEQDLSELFACFSELRIDRRRVTTGGGRFADDDWLVTATR